ncbi:hypothetical protein IZY60_10580 [Lutibacter sp. B2]|nr:hypothetical protein [Lutibacter sp. B2]
MNQELEGIDFKKGIIILLVFLGILIVPILLISGLSFIVKWSTTSIDTKELIINLDSPIKLGEYLYYYISVVGIEITGVLSYALLETSKKSNQLSQDINKKEEKKDEEKIRESALIVYYDLLLGLKDLKSLYISRIIHKSLPEPKKMLIRENFIKNIAILNKTLSDKEIEKICEIYRSFLTIKELLFYVREDGNNSTKSSERTLNEQNLDDEVTKLAKEVFKGILIDYIQFELTDDVTLLLNLDHFEILNKIKLMTYKKVSREGNVIKGDGEIIFEGKLDEDGYLHDKKGKLYSQVAKEARFIGAFENGKFILGSEIAYRNTEKLFEFQYEKGKIVSGKLYKKQNNHIDRITDERIVKDEIIESNIVNNNVYFNVEKFDEDEEEKPLDGYIEKYYGAYCRKCTGEVYTFLEGMWLWCNVTRVELGEFKNGEMNGKGFVLQKEYEEEYKLILEELCIGQFDTGSLENGKKIIKRNKNCSQLIIDIKQGEEIKTKWNNWSGEQYEIEAVFKNKESIGKGKCFRGETIFYKGEMKEGGVKTGYGIEYYPCGQKKYEGKFVTGQFHGNGKLYTENNELLFDGEFKEGQTYTGFKHPYKTVHSQMEATVYHQIVIDRNLLGLKTPKENFTYEGYILEGKLDEAGKVCIDGDCYDVKYEKGNLLNLEEIKALFIKEKKLRDKDY